MLLFLGAGVLNVSFNLWQSAACWPWLFIPGYVPLLLAAVRVQRNEDPKVLNGMLKLTALGSLSCNLLLALGFALG